MNGGVNANKIHDLRFFSLILCKKKEEEDNS